MAGHDYLDAPQVQAISQQNWAKCMNGTVHQVGLDAEEAGRAGYTSTRAWCQDVSDGINVFVLHKRATLGPQ